MKSEEEKKPSLKPPEEPPLHRLEWEQKVAELVEQMSPEQKAQAREALYKASAVRPR